MEYKLLNNGRAVLVTRKPEVIYDDLTVSFSGAPEGATAVIEILGITLYRDIKDGVCSIPWEKLKGDIKITVMHLNGTIPTPTWSCDEISAEALKDEGILIYPNSLDLERIISDLRLENDHIRQENEDNKKTLKAIQTRLEDIMNAYDFT